MTNCTSTCFIIPKYVKEVLVKQGLMNKVVVDKALKMDASIRRARKKNISSLMSADKNGAAKKTKKIANRTVYNCQNSESLEKNHELRGEKDKKDVKDADANLSFLYAGVVRDYYGKNLNRNSLDDKGLDLDLFIHYSKGYDNAFWDGKEMVFGDGDGHIFKHLVCGIDVIGHELTHGVVQYTAALTNAEFPGTINEHIADVFGTVIKQDYKKQDAQNADWLIGDDVILPSFPGVALRSMKAPGTAFKGDPQPAHMKNYKPWNNDPHLNNGIPNRAFYLVSAGVNNITGLDTKLAGLLWYTALLNLKSTANFKDLYQTIKNAGAILTANKKIPDSSKLIDAAFKTVGII
jgi:Zn-dependent metalloprotease